MRLKKRNAATRFFSFLAFLGLLNAAASAQTNTMTAGTSWSAGTWSLGHVPTASEDAVINSNLTVSITTPAVCKNLTLGNATSSNASLTVGSGGSLNASGNLSINPSGNNRTYTLAAGANNITIGGTVSVNATGTNSITVSTGSLSFTNATGITWSTGTLSMTGAGSISFTGLVTQSGGTIQNTTTGGTITFSGGYTKSAGTFTSLTGETINFGGSLTVSGTALTFATGSTGVFTANATITPTAAITFHHFKMTGGTATLAGNITVNGDWTNDGGTFSGASNTVTLTSASGTIGGTTSTAFPNLTLAVGAAYTMNNDNSASSLTIGATTNATATTLTQASGKTLTISGAATINQPTANSITNAWNINAGIATVSGLVTFAGSGTTTSRVGKIVITTGTLNANGGITMVAGANACHVIDMSTGGGTGTLNLKGTLTAPANSGTLTAGTSGSNFSYSDNAAQTIGFFPTGAYNNLKINNTSASGATLGAAITSTNVTGNITVGDVNSGSLFNTNNLAVQLLAGKTLTVAANSTMDAGTTSIGFSATNASNAVTVNGTFKTANTAGFSGAAGTAISSTNTPAITLGSASTIEYTSASAQAVTQRTDYANLAFSGAGTKTVAAGTTSLSGNWAVGSPTAFTSNPTINVTGNITGNGNINATTSTTINIGGNWTNTGTFTASSGTVNFNGSTAQAFTPTVSSVFNIVKINNATGVTLGAAISVSTLTIGDVTSASIFNDGGNQVTSTGTLNLTSGTLKLGSAAATTFPAFTTSSISSGTTVEYAAAVAQAVSATPSYQNLAFSGAGAKTTASGTLSIAGNWSVSGGTATLSTNNTSATVTGNITGTGNITSGSGTIIVSGSWSNSGTFTCGNGTVNFNGSGTQSIPAYTYNNLTASTSGTKTAAGAITVNAQLNIASGVILDMATNILTGSSMTTTGTGTIKTQNTASTTLLPTGRTWTMAVEYNATSAQSVVAGTYADFTISGTGNKTMRGSISVSGALALTGGTLVVGANNTLTISGSSVSRTSGSINASSGTATVVFSNTSPLTLPSLGFTGAVTNFTVSGGSSVKLGSSQTIQGALTLTSGKLEIGSGNTLTLAGTVSGMSAANSITTSSSSNLAISGSGALGTLFFDQTTDGTTNTLTDFTINRTDLTGTLSIGNILKIKGSVIPTAGTVTTGGFLTIASDASGSGRILSITDANFAFNGNVVVQRYVSAKSDKRRYIFIASQVDNITIRNAWQDDIFITGSGTGGSVCGSTTGNGTVSTDKYNSNGFDASISNLTTIYTYDQSNAARWVSIANTTSTTVSKGKGYRVLYRGARGTNDANCIDYLTSQTPGTPSAATFSVSGPVTKGDVNVSISAKTTGTFGYTLIGNPYACEIDWGTFQANNSSVIDGSYWTHDPNSSSTTGYLTFNNGSATGVGANSSGVITSSNGWHIASGQAFFVQSSNGGTATFKESYKSSSAQLGVFRGAAATWENRIRVGYHSYDGAYIDDVLIRFSDDPTVTVTENSYWDAITLNATNFLASIKGTKSFAIQTRPLNFYDDTVMLRVVSATQGDFKLSFSEYADFTAAAEIILLDLFTGTQTDVKANPLYTFSVTSNAASQGGRFKLVFRSARSVLPLSFLDISAQNKNNGVEVSWRLAFEQNVSGYTVERSANGREFEGVGTVSSRGNSSLAVAYSFLDTKPLEGTVYYRVRSNEAGAAPKYSAVVKVNSSRKEILTLYPNPVKDQLKVVVPNSSFSKPGVLIRSIQGKTILQASAATINGISTIDVSGLTTGIYLITLTNSNGENVTGKFIKN